jgi:hypothetical protein
VGPAFEKLPYLCKARIMNHYPDAAFGRRYPLRAADAGEPANRFLPSFAKEDFGNNFCIQEKNKICF